MKQVLNGKDWLVSHFLTDEVGSHYPRIGMIAAGNLYGQHFIPATVPGDVQSDALDAGLFEDINVGYNARSAEWTSSRDWVYVKRFTPEQVPCKKILLCFDGVDYACDVFLNGKWIGSHENTFLPFSLDITEKLLMGQENSLIVEVLAAPAEQSQGGRCTNVRHFKPRFTYGWDFCTRLIPLGIWRDVYIDYQQDAAIEDLHLISDLDIPNKKAVLSAEIKLTASVTNCPALVTLTHPDGTKEEQTVTINADTARVDFPISNPQLWYPNGMGQQPLYTVTVTLADNWDSRTAHTGLRKITWSRAEGAGEDALEYTAYVNGRRVYLQGYNWVPVRQLYGREHKEAYEKRIELVRRSGSNFLRVWGAGLLERELFYDLCDKAGILVLQELFQSSCSRNNHPSREKDYIDRLLETVESAVIQKRNHPSLAIWCGGNELCFRSNYMDAKGNILIEGAEGNEGRSHTVSGHWIPLSPEYPTLAAMEKVVKKLDPDRKWLHTSGSGPITQSCGLAFVGGAMHDVHGPWALLGPTDFYTNYNAFDMMAHMEFGCPGAASVQTLETILPPQHRWPLDAYNNMANYHGILYVTTAGSFEKLSAFFANITNYRQYSLASRFLQWEQLRYALEAHRRLDKKCAASCLWQLGEPWANVAESCSVDIYDQPKPAYYGEAAAFRPLHIAPRYDSVIYKDSLDIQMTLYNTTLSAFTGSICVQTFAPDGTLLETYTTSCSAQPDSVVPAAGEVCFKNLPEGLLFMRYTLLDTSNTVLETGYSVFSSLEQPYSPLLSQPECAIHAVLNDNRLTLKNCGNAIVSGLTLECDNDQHVFFSDGCIMLLPGEETTITVEFTSGKQVPLYISGFGVPYQKLQICCN